MPLLEVSQCRYVTASIRLDIATVTQIDQYAAFVNGLPDDVVGKALKYVFSRDRDFQEFLKTAQAAEVIPTLRVRRGGNGEISEPSGSVRRPAAGVESRNGARREPAPKA